MPNPEPTTRLRLAFCAAWLTCIVPACAAGRWEIQYFYDKNDSTLDIADLACPSAKRCVAVGNILENGKKPRGAAVITGDGGDHWFLQPMKEHPRSVFFLNANDGWVVTEKDVWRTNDGGSSWEKTAKLPKIARVLFLDALHGFAAGAPKTVEETKDGGRTWTRVAAADEPPANPEESDYYWIVFPTPLHGFILGEFSPRVTRAPAWMDPERARFRYRRPSRTILIETEDGGKSWKTSASSNLGDVQRIRSGGPDFALALVSLREFADYPSEVFRLDLKTRKALPVFREAHRSVVDAAVLPDGEAFLACIERPGRLNVLPIPGKLKILRSNGLKSWIDMDVDYRAVAGSATLAAPDANHMWVATDTGMILKLTTETIP